MPNQDFDCLDENLGYDATNSWSGYNYQGKTAIYIALRKINSLYSSNNGTAIPAYFLELEWLEDFSIIYQVDGKMNYESTHQVKARKDTKISSSCIDLRKNDISAKTSMEEAKKCCLQ